MRVEVEDSARKRGEGAKEATKKREEGHEYLNTKRGSGLAEDTKGRDQI